MLRRLLTHRAATALITIAVLPAAASGQCTPTDVLLSEDFSTPTGWTQDPLPSALTKHHPVQWIFGNPLNHPVPLTDPFALADSSGAFSPADTTLISPVINVSASSGCVLLSFNHDFKRSSSETADVQVRSTATGGNWTVIQTYAGADASGAVTLDMTPYSAPDLQISFRYVASFDWWWAIDDVVVGTDPTWIFTDGFESGDTTRWSLTEPPLP